MRKKLFLRLGVLASVVLLVFVYLYLRPLPAINASVQTPAPPKTEAAAIPWPAFGQAAIGAGGYGLLANTDKQTPVSIASIAKVITALAVLKQKPMDSAGTPGPVLTVDATDVGYYDYYSANGGSVAKVVAGEQLNEYQLLQAMLLPSANNIADSLARWAFGSQAAYLTYANQMVKDMGLAGTTVGDTNGFADKTTSTAADVVKLGIAAIKNPVIADIVSQSSAEIPVTGTVKNVNWLLGSYGVDGIKTGNTAAAGGCYLFASKQTILGQTMTIVSAVLGAPQLNDAISAAPGLIQSAAAGFTKVTPVYKDEALAYYLSPWQASSRLVSPKDLSLVVWKGKDIKIESNLESVKAPAAAGQTVGSVTIQSSGQTVSSPLVLSQGIAKPGLSWRIFR